VHRRGPRHRPLLHGRRAEGRARARKPFGQWTERTTRIDDIVKADAVEKPVFGSEELRRRQLAVGYTLEELEAILHPMVEEASEAVGSMGDDTPVAVLSQQYRGLHHYFRQTFSQGHQPADRQPARDAGDDAEDPPRATWATSSTRTRPSATC
jgi:hypothetical protein